jgi:cytochrome c-type biogenesis protein CcmH/NrfG
VNPLVSAVAVAALATIAATGVMAGFRRRDLVPVEPLGDPLEDRRVALERSLADLEDAHDGGALEDAEFVRLRDDTRTRLARVHRAIDAKHRPVEPDVAASAVAAKRDPMRVPPWAVGLLIAGVVGAIVLSSVTRETVTPPAAAAPATNASNPFAFFQERVKAHPDDVAARLDLARRYLDAGKVQEAVEQYGAALKLDPTNAEARAQIGLILYLNGRAKEALASVDAALQVAPDYPEALFYRGVILFRGLDRPGDAIDAFQRYLDAAPFGQERVRTQKLIDQARAEIAAGATP